MEITWKLHGILPAPLSGFLGQVRQGDRNRRYSPNWSNTIFQYACQKSNTEEGAPLAVRSYSYLWHECMKNGLNRTKTGEKKATGHNPSLTPPTEGMATGNRWGILS
jgi:hypothetical protein